MPRLKKLRTDTVRGHMAGMDTLLPGLRARTLDAVTPGVVTNPKCLHESALDQADLLSGRGSSVRECNPLDLHSYGDIADNTDATISIMSGATEIEFVDSEGVDEGQIDKAPDIPATIDAVATGRADATTATEMTAVMAAEGNDEVEFVEDF